MAEKDWAAILKNEDRIIANSDRRFRYHCYSLESMSEELTYKERSIYIQQRYAIELAFWEGYQYKEIAVIFGCSPAAVTLLLQRAFHRLRSFLAE